MAELLTSNQWVSEYKLGSYSVRRAADGYEIGVFEHFTAYTIAKLLNEMPPLHHETREDACICDSRVPVRCPIHDVPRDAAGFPVKTAADETPVAHAPNCAALACREDGMQNWNRACDCGALKTAADETLAPQPDCIFCGEHWAAHEVAVVGTRFNPNSVLCPPPQQMETARSKTSFGEPPYGTPENT